VLRNRIETSDEAREWRLTHLDEYQDARSWMTDAADYVVDTAASTPPQIARRIFGALPDLPAPAAAPATPAAARSAAPAPAPAAPAPAPAAAPATPAPATPAAATAPETASASRS
jgi:hypothetical protein